MTDDVRVAVAAPFRRRGVEEMDESAFVVAVSLDRDWFSPDQAKRLIDVADARGLLDRSDGGTVTVAFDPASVSVPEGFAPDESVLRTRSPFERALESLVEAGHDKREAVAAINRLQGDLGVTADAAAVVYARRQGIDVEGPAAATLRALRED